MKRIIICCDGTWNDLEMRYITNVGRLAQALKHRTDDGVEQLLFYDNGIGADSKGFSRIVDGGVGKGMDDNIAEAYRFLCFNYEEGDEICLFGFSRGAYTVRSLAGMIGKAGLVSQSNLKQIAQAMEVYRSDEDPAPFRKKYGTVPPIALLGCWDTVGALGIPDKVPWLPFDNWSKQKYEFHDTKLGSHIKLAIHAVAVDDRRVEFAATLMEKGENAPADQKLIQVWFPGDHSCVGGGSWEKRGLSNAALRWMVETATKNGINLAYDLDRLSDRAVSDHGIYLLPSMRVFYSKATRPFVGKWSDLHESVIARWKELSDYRPPEIKARFAAKLKAAKPSNIRKSLASVKSLAVNGTTDVRVFSEKKSVSSKVKVKKGEIYRIVISGTQVWKDGGLDPCDIRGWSLTKSKPAWKKGEKVDFGSTKRKIIKSFKKKCPVPKADFFELIAKVGNGKYTRLNIPAKTDANDQYVIEFLPQKSGELVFAANDVSSSLDFIDKYDNNRGWVWLRLERVS